MWLHEDVATMKVGKQYVQTIALTALNITCSGQSQKLDFGMFFIQYIADIFRGLQVLYPSPILSFHVRYEACIPM
jgi:hypothetical protein